jgi:sugar phosphate isomerase/epimerase
MSASLPLLSLASGVLPEFSPERTAAAAVAAGWPAVGLWVEAAAWTASTTRDVRAAVRAGGIAVLDVEVIWIKPGRLDADHLRLLDIGAEVGARNVLAVSSDPDVGAAAGKLAALAAHAGTLGLRIALEFGAFTEVRTLADALALLARPELAALSLLVDPLHFARTFGRPEQLAAVPAERFAYAQFCDAPAEGPHPDDVAGIIHEAVDLRLLPGAGGLPLGALLRALPAGLPLSVELRSKALRDGFADPAERARAVLAATVAALG